MTTIHSHKELIVWQKAVALVIAVYKLTNNFPKEEVFGLTSQMRRAAVSIPSNIAEGRSRGTKKDFVQFLRVALGSCSELETQIEIAKAVIDRKVNYDTVHSLLNEVVKMLSSMIRKLNPSFKALAAQEAKQL